MLELDPLVRKDICEALAEEFEGATILDAETVEGLRDLALTITGPVVAVLAVPSDALKAALGQMDDMLSELGFVIIGDPPPTASEPQQRHVYLPRPFSSAILIQSVRAALLGLDLCPPDT